MEEELISFETAKLAKEKGFNIPTISYYNPKGRSEESEGYMTERLESSNWNDGQGSYPTHAKDVECSAPTQSLLQKWLREVHNCFINVLPHRDGDSKNKQWKSKKDVFWTVEVDYYGKNFEIELTDDSDFTQHFNKSYEEALEIGLYQALKLIK